MIDQLLYSRLSTADDLTDLVGDRIYAMELPPEIVPVYPYIVYAPGGRAKDNTLDGPSKLYQVKVSVLVVAESYDDCRRIGQAVRELLDGEDWRIDGGRVQGAFFDDDESNGIVEATNSEKRIFIEEQVYNVWVEELG